MSMRYIVKVNYTAYEFDNSQEAISFAELSFKHYRDRNEERPDVSIELEEVEVKTTEESKEDE